MELVNRRALPKSLVPKTGNCVELLLCCGERLCIKWHRSAIPLYNEAFYLFGLVVTQDDRPEPSVAVVLSFVDCYVSENEDAPGLSLPSDCFLVELHDSRVPAIECLGMDVASSVGQVAVHYCVDGLRDSAR